MTWRELTGRGAADGPCLGEPGHGSLAVEAEPVLLGCEVRGSGAQSQGRLLGGVGGGLGLGSCIGFRSIIVWKSRSRGNGVSGGSEEGKVKLPAG